MKSTIKSLRIIVWGLAGISMFACAFLSTPVSESPPTSQPSDETKQETTTPPPNPAEGNFVSVGDTVQISEDQGVPPSDVISQISISGKGGPGDPTPVPVICEKACIEKQGNLITLSLFEPNQLVRVEIYSIDGTGLQLVFLKEIVVMVDQDGYFEFNVEPSGDINDLEFRGLDEAGSSLPIECASEEMSKFSIGMNVVIAGEQVGYYEVSGDGGRSILGRLDAGANVSVDNGPVCRDKYVYWHIKTGEGTEGWVIGQNIEPAQ